MQAQAQRIKLKFLADECVFVQTGAGGQVLIFELFKSLGLLTVS